MGLEANRAVTVGLDLRETYVLGRTDNHSVVLDENTVEKDGDNGMGAVVELWKKM